MGRCQSWLSSAIRHRPCPLISDLVCCPCRCSATAPCRRCASALRPLGDPAQRQMGLSEPGCEVVQTWPGRCRCRCHWSHCSAAAAATWHSSTPQTLSHPGLQYQYEHHKCHLDVSLPRVVTSTSERQHRLSAAGPAPAWPHATARAVWAWPQPNLAQLSRMPRVRSGTAGLRPWHVGQCTIGIELHCRPNILRYSALQRHLQVHASGCSRHRVRLHASTR